MSATCACYSCLLPTDNKENQQLQAALLQSNTAILEQLRELRQENAHLSQQMTNLVSC